MKPYKNNIADVYPLSPLQAGMLFHSLNAPGSTAFVQQMSWGIKGQLDFTAFEKAWNEVIRRHDILRTFFAYHGVAEPVQVVLETYRLTITQECIAESRLPDPCALIKKRERELGFDLQKGPPLRLCVVYVGERACEIILTHHHLIMDGWSLGNLVKEVLDLYGAYSQGSVVTRAQPGRYRDYLAWYQKQDKSVSTDFWAQYLAGLEEGTSLPPRGGHPPEFESGVRHFKVQPETLSRLEALAASCDVTLSIVLQFVWGLVLGQYSGRDDVVFGAVVSGRTGQVAHVEQICGMFINTVPVRVRLRGQDRIDQHLKDMQIAALEALDHHQSSLAEIQKLTPAGANLLQSFFVMENFPLDDALEENQPLPGTDLIVTHVESWEDSEISFGIRFIPDQGLVGKLVFPKQDMEGQLIDRLLAHFQGILENLTPQMGARQLSDLTCLYPAEMARLEKWGHRKADFDMPENLSCGFDQQVARTPDQPALRWGQGALTYRQLQEKVDDLANRITGEWACEGNPRIALLLPRGELQIIAILACLKVGAAYVPLEATMGADRIEFILRDSGAIGVLIARETLALAQGLSACALLNIEGGAKTPVGKVFQNAGHRDLAYVIYTSGTTGTPKGVAVEQGNVLNMAYAMDQEIYRHLAGPLNTTLITSYVFDGSVQQIFTALLFGHCLNILEEDAKRNPRLFREFCVDHHIDVCGCIPNFLQVLADTGELPALKQQLQHIIFGGEPLNRELIDQIQSLPGEMGISNLYGPTETCVNATAFTIFANHKTALHDPVVPIGSPLANVKLQVRDPFGQLTPAGGVGELWVSGAGVAQGYLNQPELTQSCFVEEPAGRFYRTGDLVRWSEDGRLLFCGRRDQQVKISGYRIEIPEIERALSMALPVGEGYVVAVLGTDGRSVLRACLVGIKAAEVENVRNVLSDRLPRHMVPTQWMILDELPLLISGKIDRKTLMDRPYQAPQKTDIEGPRTEAETALVAVWERVFQQAPLSINDNYYGLGGDSIRAIQIMSQLYQFGYQLDMADLFAYPTIKLLAPHLKSSQQIEIAAQTGPFGLLPAQQRFFDLYGGDVNRFNHAVWLDSRQPLEIEVLERAVQTVGAHHEAFSLRFSTDKTGKMQQEKREASHPIRFETYQVDHCSPDVCEQMANAAHAQIDIENGPLAVVHVIEAADTSQRLLVVIHHLIIDGVSWRVFAEDLSAAYNRLRVGAAVDLLPATPLSAWEKWISDYKKNGKMRDEVRFWSRHVAHTVAPFPVENPDGSRERGENTIAQLVLSEAETDALQHHAHQAFGTNVQDILIAALARGFYRWKRLERVWLAMESHGRDYGATEMNIARTVGWFTAVYPFLCRFTPDAEVDWHIKTIKEDLRRIPHGGFAYGLLEDQLPHPVKPQVSFNYLGDLSAEDPSGAALFSVDTDHTGQELDETTQRHYELDISAMVLNGKMSLQITFARARFDAVSLEELLIHWRDAVLEMTDYCQKQLGRELTPSDLSIGHMSLDEFEGLFS